MSALPNKPYDGYCKDKGKVSNQRTPGKKTWRKKCEQQLEDDEGGSRIHSWMRQVACCALMVVTTQYSRKSSQTPKLQID